jgi:RNA polymerase sigma-70 factor (ECF subfamily)
MDVVAENPMAVVTLPTEPDLMLLHRFIETGDPAIFAEIVQRYTRVVYAASLRILGDEGRAQDVSQETFFRLMQRPKVVTHSLAGWLHRTATHLALDVRRGEKSRRAREQTYSLEQQQAKACQTSWADVSPYVDQALNEIEEPTRGLLIRHFLQAVPQADLAVELDVSPATLSRRIKAGLDQLQQQLRKKGIYVGLVALGGFCASNTSAAIPTAFVTEMGKMNLIASLKQMPPSVPPPRGPYHAPYQMNCNPSIFVPAKFAAALAGISLVIAAYAFATAASWMHANPSDNTVSHQTEPPREAK